MKGGGGGGGSWVLVDRNSPKDLSKQLSKEAIMRQGKLREITKCLL